MVDVKKEWNKWKNGMGTCSSLSAWAGKIRAGARAATSNLFCIWVGFTLGGLAVMTWISAWTRCHPVDGVAVTVEADSLEYVAPAACLVISTRKGSCMMHIHDDSLEIEDPCGIMEDGARVFFGRYIKGMVEAYIAQRVRTDDSMTEWE